MEMLPYIEIAKRKEDIKPLVLKFDSFEKPALLVDFYCTNPLCGCTDLLLQFNELSDDEITGELFSIRLNTITWEITDRYIKRRNVECKEIIDEFMSGLDSSIKGTLLSHIKEAKGYGRQNPLEAIDVSMIEDGNCVPYADVFGDEDVNKLVFEYKGVNYLVDDHYCMRPDCLCNEAVLAFFDILSERKVQEAKFAIRLGLNDLKYEIEHRNVSRKELNEIVQYFLNTKKDEIMILKNRYQKMKGLGKKLLNKNNTSALIPVQANDKAGRNDPCPCGSGKKYKKCCGR